MRSAILQITAIILAGAAVALMIAGPVKPGQTTFADHTVSLNELVLQQGN